MEVIIVNPEDKLPVAPLVDIFKEFELWKRRKRYKGKKEENND